MKKLAIVLAAAAFLFAACDKEASMNEEKAAEKVSEQINPILDKIDPQDHSGLIKEGLTLRDIGPGIVNQLTQGDDILEVFDKNATSWEFKDGQWNKGENITPGSADFKFPVKDSEGKMELAYNGKIDIAGKAFPADTDTKLILDGKEQASLKLGLKYPTKAGSDAGLKLDFNVFGGYKLSGYADLFDTKIEGNFALRKDNSELGGVIATFEGNNLMDMINNLTLDPATICMEYLTKANINLYASNLKLEVNANIPECYGAGNLDDIDEEAKIFNENMSAVAYVSGKKVFTLKASAKHEGNVSTLEPILVFPNGDQCTVEEFAASENFSATSAKVMTLLMQYAKIINEYTPIPR